jgi:very-short-patch-repair endonuclease
MSIDCITIDIAVHQYGLFERGQATELGMSPEQIDRRVATGRWRGVQPGVYIVGAAPPSPHQQLLAGCLAAGGDAIASHRAAAWLWGLDGFRSGPVELTLASHRGARPVGALLHHSQRFDPVDRTVRSGVPVTTRERTIIDLGAVVRPLRVEMALESYLRTGGSITRLGQRLEAIGGRGCRGVGVLREILEGRRPGRGAGSPLEVRFSRLLRDAGARMPERQYPIAVHGGEVYVVDAAYADRMVAIELQGEEYHGTGRAVRRDRRRFSRLARVGWTGVEFTTEDIEDHPEFVIGTLLDLVPDLFADDPGNRGRLQKERYGLA